MLKRFRAWLLDIVYPLVVYFAEKRGLKHVGDEPNLLKADRFRCCLEDGDIVMAFKEGAMTNVLVPGYWSHCGIYDKERDRVIEALHPKVQSNPLELYLGRYTDCAIYRAYSIGSNQQHQVVINARAKIGSPYDFDFESKNRAFYCSELCYLAHWRVDNRFAFPIERIWGVKTILPDDFTETPKFVHVPVP